MYSYFRAQKDGINVGLNVGFKDGLTSNPLGGLIAIICAGTRWPSASDLRLFDLKWEEGCLPDGTGKQILKLKLDRTKTTEQGSQWKVHMWRPTVSTLLGPC